MATEPVKEAVDPAREADNAPPTVLHGTLTVEVPGGETMVLKTTFDSGSNTDAVSALLHLVSTDYQHSFSTTFPSWS